MSTKYSAGQKGPHLSWWEFVFSDSEFQPTGRENLFAWLATNMSPPTCRSKPPCSPISHHLDTLLLVCYNKNHGLLRELPATSKTNIVVHQVTVDSQV